MSRHGDSRNPEPTLGGPPWSPPRGPHAVPTAVHPAVLPAVPTAVPLMVPPAVHPRGPPHHVTPFFLGGGWLALAGLILGLFLGGGWLGRAGLILGLFLGGGWLALAGLILGLSVGGSGWLASSWDSLWEGRAGRPYPGTLLGRVGLAGLILGLSLGRAGWPYPGTFRSASGSLAGVFLLVALAKTHKNNKHALSLNP